MFQSTPDLVNRENIVGLVLLVIDRLFQSTPDLVNRENRCQDPMNANYSSFNPLPI